MQNGYFGATKEIVKTPENIYSEQTMGDRITLFICLTRF